MLKNNKYFIVFTFIIFLFACEKNKNVSENNDKQQSTEKTKFANKKIDSCKQFLQDGCIVLRKGNDIISEMFSMLNKTDKRFSHCGIAFLENNTWMVYHSIGGEDNPNEKLRKDRYETFVRSSHNDGFGICTIDFNQTQKIKLHDIVDSLYKIEVPFDMKFDLESNDRLYCAEMVYKAINKTLETDSLFSITNHQGFQYVSTDNIFKSKEVHLLCSVKY